MNHDINKIIDIICNLENCDVDLIKSSKRNAEYVYCRGIITLILREVTNMNFRQIGKYINRNKSTSSKLYYKYSQLCDSSTNIKIKYIKILNKLNNEKLI